MIADQNGKRAVAILGVENFKREMAGQFRGLEVMLCLDNDESGREAVRRIAGIFSLQGQSVKAPQLPEGIKDITEYYIK